MSKFVYKKNQIGQTSPEGVALKFGNKDISSIADGTLTGAIFYLDALISSGEVTDGGGLIIGNINESHTSFIVDGDLIVTPSKSFIFVDMNTNISYRWDGEKYVAMNSGILLGETSDRAFPGDRGKDLENNKVDKIDGMGLSTNDFTDYYKKKLEGIEANANYFDSTKLSSLNLAIFATDANHRTVTEAEKSKWNDKYTKSEIESLLSSLPLGLIWKDSVDDYNAILTTYPNPEENWTVSTIEGNIYTYNGEGWVQINMTIIPAVSLDANGLMTPSLLEKLNGIADNANNFKITDVTADNMLDGVEKVIMTLSERNQLKEIPKLYRGINTKIVEKDIDANFLTKLLTKDGGLINDNAESSSTTYSSSKINSLFEELKTNELTEAEMDTWFV